MHAREPRRSSPGGRPLDGETKGEMERAFGRDFSAVRVHDSAVAPLRGAAHPAQTLGATAFTQGADIFFAPGQYAPGTARGRRTLAHELTHVAQEQSAPDGAREQRVSSPTDDAEREASSNAERIDAGARLPARARPRAAIHRITDPSDVVERAASLLVPFVDDVTLFTRTEMFEFVTGKSTQTKLTPPKLALNPSNPDAVPTREEELDPVIERMKTNHVIKWDDALKCWLGYRTLAKNQTPEWGSEQSKAPIATSPEFRPQAQFAQHYMDLAGKLIPWIDARTTSFTRADLFGDQDAMKLVGSPATEEELKPMLDLLVKYGVLSMRPDGSFQPVRAGGVLSTQRFNKAAKEIADPNKTAANAKYPYPKAEHDLAQAPRNKWGTGGFDEVPDASAPGGKRKIFLKDRAAAADQASKDLADLEKQLETETDDAKQNDLRKKIAEKKKTIDANTKHWQFAPSVSKFLAALKKLTDASSDQDVSGWTAATYSGHQWEEYSADINLGGRSGPWPEAAVYEFFKLLNQAAESEGMAWRAIYDPDAVRAKLNQMFGQRRVLEDKPRHSDHIHLNVTPTKLDQSEVKGFK